MEYKTKFTPKPPVDFPGGEPVVMTLDTEPSEAKETSKGGKFTIFTREGQVFWADELLKQELSKFSKGDVVAITRTFDYTSKNNDWVVEESDETPKASVAPESKGGGLETRVADLEKRVTKLEGTSTNGEKEKEDNKEEDGGEPVPF